MDHPPTDLEILGYRLDGTVSQLLAQITRLTGALNAERDQRERLSDLLRRKDEAMGVLFERLAKAGVDCSDLIS